MLTIEIIQRIYRLTKFAGILSHIKPLKPRRNELILIFLIADLIYSAQFY